MHLCSFNLSVTQRKAEGCVGGGKEVTKRGRKKEEVEEERKRIKGINLGTCWAVYKP